MTVLMVRLLALTVLAACGSTRSTSFHIDHVILGVSDLDAGIRELEVLTGVHAVPGGRHPGHDTQNALVSLGPETYLEIIAPVPGSRPADLTSLSRLTPVGFALFAPDLVTTRADLARAGLQTTAPEAGTRATPVGSTLHWSTFETVDAELHDVAPFFIHWDDLALHPARSSPGGCLLTSVEIFNPDARVVARLALAPTVHPHVGPAALIVTLRCGARSIRIAT